MDDEADVRQLRTEDLYVLNTLMNTTGSRKQQPFGDYEQFKSKVHINFPEI